MAVGKSGVIQHTLYNDYYITQHGYSYVDVYWQEEYDVATNSSVIKVTKITFRHSKYGGSWTVYGKVTIDGTEYSFYSNIGSGGEISNPITSNRIYHDDATGAKSITISTACNTVGGSGGTQFYDTNHGTASVTVALTTIPRLSEISTANGTLGVAQKLTVTQKSTSYTHSIGWKCGSASGTICTKSSTLTFNWTPAMDLASQNKTGTSVSVVFTITTYSGDTSIGSKTLTITCAIPASVKPSVTMTITDANGYASKYGSYVQKRSKLKVVLGVVTAYGSEIATNAVSVEGVTYYGESIETAIINGSGTLSVKATVTDKRGRIGTATVNVDVLPYTQPAILGVTYNRADADGTDNAMGEYAEVSMNASVTALGGNNSATYRLQYKKLSDSTYTDFDMSGYQNVYSLEDAVAIFAASADNSYNIVFTVSDDFSAMFGVAKTEFILQTGKVLMHRRAKGNGMGLGRICEEDDLLDVDWNIRGRKEMQIDGNVEAQNIKVNGGLITAKPVAPRNLLDNSDFTNPVNQRGVTSLTQSTTQTYFVDRWYSARTTLSVTNNGLSFAWDGTNGTDGWIQQKLPNGSKMYGKTVTVAIEFADGHKHFATGVIPTTTNQSIAASAYDSYGLRVLLSNMANSDVFSVVIAMKSTTAVTIKNVALYEGEYTAETLPHYVPKGYGAELLECQRYYWRLNDLFRIRCNQTTPSLLDFFISLPVPMRVEPTLVTPSEAYVYSMTSTANSGFTLTIPTVSEASTKAGYLMIRATKANHGLTDGWLNIPSGSYFNADL